MSGVLATVVTGVCLGTRTEGMLQAASRVSGTMFWRTLIFLLESALFVLLGLELRSVFDHLSRGYSVAWLAGTAAAVVAAVVVIRLAWELMVSPLIRFIPGQHSGYVRNPWRQRLVIGWGGMRGAMSLAIALTLPLEAHGQRFTERPTLVFLAAVVVIVTLVCQGLTLGPLLGALGLSQGDGPRRREAVARQRVTKAGLRLDDSQKTATWTRTRRMCTGSCSSCGLSGSVPRSATRTATAACRTPAGCATSWSARSAPS